MLLRKMLFLLVVLDRLRFNKMKLTNPRKIQILAKEFGVENYIIKKVLAKKEYSLKLDDLIWDGSVSFEEKLPACPQISLRERWVSAIQKELSIPDLRKQTNNAGIVYVASCDIFAEHIYKIGFTHCLENRIISLTEALGSKKWKRETQTGTIKNRIAKCGQYFPIFTWDVPNKEKGESELHKLLEEYRIVGELFHIKLRVLYNMTRFFYPSGFKNYLSEEEFSTKPFKLKICQKDVTLE